MPITIAAGRAVSDNRERFLTKDASKVEGRCLNEEKKRNCPDKRNFQRKRLRTSNLGTVLWGGKAGTMFEVKNSERHGRGRRKAGDKKIHSPYISRGSEHKRETNSTNRL